MSHPLVAQMVASARSSGAGWMRTNCLACPDRAGKADTKASFAVSVKTGYYRCLRCRLRGFLPGHERFIPDAEQQAADRKAKEGDVECRRLPKGFHLLDSEPAVSSRVAQPAIQFLNTRKIGRDLRVRAGIGACLLPGTRFYGRVICPLTGDDGQLVGFVGRAWDKHAETPYLYPMGMHRGEILYGAELVTRQTDDPLVIVEGFFDALYLSSDGDAAAVLGTPSEAQMDILVEADRPVVFVLDGDAWKLGYAVAQRLRAASLAQGKRGRFAALRLDPGADPDELPPSEIFQAAREATVN